MFTKVTKLGKSIFQLLTPLLNAAAGKHSTDIEKEKKTKKQ